VIRSRTSDRQTGSASNLGKVASTVRVGNQPQLGSESNPYSSLQNAGMQVMVPVKETPLAISEEENKTTENRVPPLQ
jgi:hypothetical protein